MQINVAVFGSFLSSGTYFPTHFFIVNGFQIKEWLKGDLNHWSEPPAYKDSVFLYQDKRIAKLADRGIDHAPSAMNYSGGLWLGTVYGSSRELMNNRSDQIKG